MSAAASSSGVYVFRKRVRGATGRRQTSARWAATAKVVRRGAFGGGAGGGGAASVQEVCGAVGTIIQGTMQADGGGQQQARKAAKEVGQGRLEQRSAGRERAGARGATNCLARRANRQTFRGDQLEGGNRGGRERQGLTGVGCRGRKHEARRGGGERERERRHRGRAGEGEGCCCGGAGKWAAPHPGAARTISAKAACVPGIVAGRALAERR